jgi:hypothetical protein
MRPRDVAIIAATLHPFVVLSDAPRAEVRHQSDDGLRSGEKHEVQANVAIMIAAVPSVIWSAEPTA